MERREWSSEKLKPGTPSHKLALVLEQRNLGARSLARLIAPTPEQIEDYRRNARRWLTGTMPNQASRDTITDALGLERGSLEADPEEESLNMALLRDVRDTRQRFERIEQMLTERVA